MCECPCFQACDEDPFVPKLEKRIKAGKIAKT